MTLRFTEDERRAFGNALDRAEIEIEEHERDPFDDDDAEASRNNLRDYETAIGMWGRIERDLPELIQAAELVVAQWEGGDLAAAVRVLAATLDEQAEGA